MKQPPRIYKADPVAQQPIEQKYRYIREVRIRVAKNGQRRATYYCIELNRWFAFRIDVADYLIAGGYATLV